MALHDTTGPHTAGEGHHTPPPGFTDEDHHGTQITPEPTIGVPYSNMEKSVTREKEGPHDVPLADGEEHPSAEDLKTLRRVSDKVPFKAYTIGFVELVERMSYYGTTQVFTNFLAQPRPDGVRTGAAADPFGSDPEPGALGLGTGAATAISTFNTFWVYLMPLFGAYVADTYWGRYKTICIAVVVAVIGHTILVVSALPPVLDNPKNALAAFMIGLLIMGVGTGGFKPNISPLIAEQLPLDRMVVRKLKSGERVIVDPNVTTLRVYNWFYLFINIGSLVGQLSMSTVERFNGFYLAFLIPTVTFATIVPTVLGLCRRWYSYTPPTGSILPTAVRMLFMGARGRWHLNPVATYRHMNDGTFWENIKPSNLDPAMRPKWMNFDDAWVAELQRGYAACTVFLWYPLYWLTYNQLNSNLTNQANTMQLHGISSDVIGNLDPFALIILIPFCDLVLYPFLLRKKIRFTPIKRITCGFLLGCAAMIYTTIVQYYIYKLGNCGDHPSKKHAGCEKAPINVWVQSPAYILVAISEIFASITGLEYAFSKAPKNMRSLVMSFFLFMSAVSALFGLAFNYLAIDPYLIWNYGSAAVLSLIGGVAFWFTFAKLDAMEDQLNELPASAAIVAAQTGRQPLAPGESTA